MKKTILTLTVALVLSWTANAQTTATLEGRVVDASGGGIAGATVTVKGPTVQRDVAADAKGFYRALALPAGIYSISASSPGFKTKVLDGIEVFLDRTVTIDIPMQVAAQSESMTVQVEAPLVDVNSSSNRQVIDSRTIEAIPLNGRNYLDLILLTPGVDVNTNARADLPPARDTSGAILGERAGNTSFLIDGLENNDDVRGGVFQNFTQDAIQEFEVIDAGYKAEFGRGSGGIVNVLTKSGTDQLKGSAFFFYRNNSLDSSPISGQDPQKLKRYNSGLTLGGPVVKERAWVFGSFEYFNEKRQSIFPPNIPASLAATEDFSRQPKNDNYRIFGKYNQALSHSNDVRVEASWTRNENLNQLATATALPSASLNNRTKTFLGTAAMNTILSNSSLLESSLGYRNQRFSQNQGGTEGRTYSISFADPIGGGFDFGPPIGSVQGLDQKYITLREAFSIFSGEKHAAKAGAEFVQTHVDGVQGSGFQYVIVTSHVNFDKYGRESFQIPQGIGFLNPGDDQIRLRNNGISLFAQDDWRVLSKLMLNLGLRYERDSKFKDNNFAPRIGFNWSPDAKTVVRANYGWFYDRYRLGIAEAVPSLGGFNGQGLVEIDYPRLAVDAPGLARTFGAVANFLKDPLFINKAFNIPAGTLVTRDNVQQLTGMTPDQFVAAVRKLLTDTGRPFYPSISFSPVTGYLRQDLSAALQNDVRAEEPFRTPYNRTVMLGVQRALLPDLAASVTYVHRNIKNILGLRIPNLSFEARNGGPLTTDGGPLRRTYGAFYDGKYDGVILSTEKRFRDRYQFQASYTYARATDNLLNSNLGLGLGAQGGGAVPTDNLNLNFDRGNSDLSVRHTFVASGIALLPAGFSVSGVLRATSGAFFSASAAVSTDYDGDGIFSRRPPGTTRNQFTGPSTFNLDLRAEKSFRVGYGMDASLLVEGFNVTNAKNPRLIDASYVSGAPSATFGNVLVPLPGRELQLGARLKF